ncbi:hypothetical protein BKA69DRAFT_1071659 [Paraphysoderma sedebokerense]|nr:hypothetical protein BKA69DRAFT_1071659 [Paraphysoderma sedebokerense]
MDARIQSFLISFLFSTFLLTNCSVLSLVAFSNETILINGNVEVAGRVVAQRPEVLSYYTVGFTSNVNNWSTIVFNQLDFNTFLVSNVFNTTNGVFTVPYNGIYRIGAQGLVPSSAGSTADVRIALMLSINGTNSYSGGGQLSGVDTPMPAYNVMVSLLKDQKVELKVYSPMEVSFGRGSKDVAYFFQLEYLGGM